MWSSYQQFNISKLFLKEVAHYSAVSLTEILSYPILDDASR